MSAFALPNFNLVCNVWHNPPADPLLLGVPDLVAMCNLANGRVQHVLSEMRRLPIQNQLAASGSILFPSGTDIRDAACFRNPDMLEVPAGTRRFYWVAFCDDIAKGFVNEHRWAVCPKVFTNGFFNYRWPVPMP